MATAATPVKWLPRAPRSRIFAPMGAGRSFALLLARIGLCGIFLYSGFHNIQHTGETASTLASLGYPVPNILAIVSAIAELAGGISILLGALTPLGCIALILFLLPTTYSFHLPGLLKGDPGETINFLKNLGLVGGLLALLFSGPGRFSVDGRIMSDRKVAKV
jgi:putative oxidoreductase